ncbi:unnamed protein product [Urochloa decumbens]|uniref:Uncharacterized protein n=1 Tax=Urochloa decumbens TaxID=240449 RepID=A0ABC8YK97_9POAL
MTYWDDCCGGKCIDHYDACCDKCCPSISHDVSDFFVNCCTWLLGGAVLATVVVLVCGFAFTHQASITAEDASLTSPNWAASWKYTEPLVAAYGFNGQSFDRVKLEDDGNEIGARKTQVYHLSTEAANEYGDGIIEFERQKVTGEFEVEVVLTSEVLYKLHYTKCTLKATCTLKLQLAPPEKPAAVSQKVKCKLAKAEKYC